MVERAFASGAALEEHLHHLLVAAKRGVVERRPLQPLAVDLRAAVEEPLRRFPASPPGGEHQRLLALVVGEVDVRAAADEELHHRDVALPCGDHQPGADALAGEVGVQPFVEPPARGEDVARLDRDAEARSDRAARRARRRRARPRRRARRGDVQGETGASVGLPVASKALIVAKSCAIVKARAAKTCTEPRARVGACCVARTARRRDDAAGARAPRAARG